MKKITVAALAMLAAWLIFTTGITAKGAAQERSRPKLILQITVDQLRGDLLERYYDRFGEGGFRYLLDGGTVYSNAHHRHANNETIVGHATLATGAKPPTGAFDGPLGEVIHYGQ